MRGESSSSAGTTYLPLRQLLVGQRLPDHRDEYQVGDLLRPHSLDRLELGEECIVLLVWDLLLVVGVPGLHQLQVGHDPLAPLYHNKPPRLTPVVGGGPVCGLQQGLHLLPGHPLTGQVLRHDGPPGADQATGPLLVRAGPGRGGGEQPVEDHHAQYGQPVDDCEVVGQLGLARSELAGSEVTQELQHPSARHRPVCAVLASEVFTSQGETAAAVCQLTERCLVCSPLCSAAH